MGQAVFAKYRKGINISQATETLNRLFENGAKPIRYSVCCEHLCSREELQFLFEKGSITVINAIANQGIYSVADAFGIWSCIKLISNSEVIIYTSGASDIMYYSIL